MMGEETGKYTLEPWRKGNGCSIVADNPAPGIGGSDNVECYGGHLICESINEVNADRVLACVNACAGINPEAVPDLLFALIQCNEVLTKALNDSHVHQTARAAIALARRTQT